MVMLIMLYGYGRIAYDCGIPMVARVPVITVTMLKLLGVGLLMLVTLLMLAMLPALVMLRVDGCADGHVAYGYADVACRHVVQ